MTKKIKRNITITLAQDRWLHKNSIDLSEFVQNQIDIKMDNEKKINNSIELEKASI